MGSALVADVYDLVGLTNFGYDGAHTPPRGEDVGRGGVALLVHKDVVNIQIVFIHPFALF